MKTPIKHKKSETKALRTLLNKIPKGSIVDSHLFYSGELELSLVEYERFVNARTTQYVIYEFWDCLTKDAHRIYNLVTNDRFKFDESVFEYLQENWAKQKGEYIRSALFFLLNRCSNSGYVSSGILSIANYNRIALAALKTFRVPKSFHLTFDNGDLTHALTSPTEATHTIVNVGLFNYNLFDEGKSYGLEETKVNHAELKDIILNTDKRLMYIYKYDQRIMEFYSHCDVDITHIDKYGNPTNNLKNSGEVIIANF